MVVISSKLEVRLNFLLATLILKSQFAAVTALQFECPLDDLPGFRADGILGGTVFEVLVDPRDLRRLRASFLQLARVASGPERRGVLVLDQPQITGERLRDEWQSLSLIMRSGILERMSLVIRRDGQPDKVFGTILLAEHAAIEEIVGHVRVRAPRATQRPSEAFFDVLRVLLIHWFRKSGPLTSKDLCEQTGFSYPTIASALERLESELVRNSDRRVELRGFPRDAWFKLLAQSEQVRASQCYTDRSGRPRSPEVLLGRLRELGLDHVAVGGVLGARRYQPSLDLVGTPRVDLILHRNNHAAARLGKFADPAAIIRKLDPALKPAGSGEPCQVVVHTLYRNEPFFSAVEKGVRWADEVECLLDLHEARLESQALEFHNRLSPKP